MGGMHGTAASLVLDPSDTESPISFYPDETNVLSSKPLDGDAHISHALYLSGECTQKRPLTIPLSAPWPLDTKCARTAHLLRLVTSAL